MEDVERWWALGAGVVGLAAFAGGSLLAAVPSVGMTGQALLDELAARRSKVLAGSVAAVTGVALLLWPLALISTAGSDGWSSLGLFALAAWVLGFSCLVVVSLVNAGLVWGEPQAIAPATARLLLDIGHLATWSVSAPVGAVSAVATTVVGVHGDLLGPVVVVLAGAKVASVVVELAGTGRRHGWNAGGWAAGVSGYFTVAWFAAVLLALR